MPRALIVGAGFGGIAAAIELTRHGIDDVVLLERAPEIGGTWFHNTYPGAACDVPSHLYSYSFAQRRDWTRICSPGPEILAYLRSVAAEYGISSLVETGVEVASARWEPGGWTVLGSDGRSWRGDALIIATGQLHRPAYPAIAGEFGGHSFHSAVWDHSYVLDGKRVAVIGTGASAVQFVPEIAPSVEQLYVFQRTANWFLPRMNRAYPAAWKAMVRSVPGLQAYRRQYMYRYAEALTLGIRNPATFGRVMRAYSTAFMRLQLRDAAVRAQVWPDYTWGCKRVLFSSKWLPALQRPNVEVVTSRIARFSGSSVVTDDGVARAVDCVIYGTGFRTVDFMFPMDVYGVNGVSLRDAWSSGPFAHHGICVPGFPSMFLMYGPNTNTSGGSIIFYAEAQARYIRKALQLAADHGGAGLDVRPEVAAVSDSRLQAQFEGTAWNSCDSWYRNASGRHVTNWPGYMGEYARSVSSVVASDFEFVDR
jgi:cation diffusion facilitator CzcD-associated flavoprotein CzcO